MCAEATWWRCHRALISYYLKARGFDVMHVSRSCKDRAASVHVGGATGEMESLATQRTIPFFSKSYHETMEWIPWKLAGQVSRW